MVLLWSNISIFNSFLLLLQNISEGNYYFIASYLSLYTLVTVKRCLFGSVCGLSLDLENIFYKIKILNKIFKNTET